LLYASAAVGRREHLGVLAPLGLYHLKGAPTDEIRATKVAMAVATRTGVYVMLFIHNHL
jgi:hypothetical protein